MGRLSLEVSPRLRAMTAAALVGAVLFALHGLALNGWRDWVHGTGETEAALYGPETWLRGEWIRYGELFSSRRERTAEEVPVQAVLLRDGPESPQRPAAIARLLDRLASLGARVVVLDASAGVEERDEYSRQVEPVIGPEASERLLAAHRDDDRALEESTRRVPLVVVSTARFASTMRSVLPPGAESRIAPFERRAAEPSGRFAAAISVGLVSFPPAILDSSESVAVRFDVPDPDGEIRRETALVGLYSRSGRRLYATPAIEAVRLALGAGPADLVFGARGLEIRSLSIPTTRDGFVLVDPREVPTAWTEQAVLSPTAHAPTFRNSVVIIGEPRARDSIPFSLGGSVAPRISHAEHLAGVVREILGGRVPRRIAAWDPARRGAWLGIGPLVTLILALASASLALWLPGRAGFRGERGRALGSTVAIMVPVFGWLALSAILAVRAGVWIDAFYPAVGVAAGAMAATTTEALAASAERRVLQTMVGRMLPPEVARRALADPRILELGGARREVTVLFADIRGFTRFAEVTTPEKVVKVLSEYHTVTTRAILAAGGAIDKLMGDGTMACFGAPQDDPAHPANAARAALAMLAALEAVNARWAAELEGVTLEIGIGINTGDVIVGNMGTPEIFTWTLIGDTVNVASRLESMNKALGTSILIGESTAQRLGPEFVRRPVGETEIRGRTGKLRIFELERPVADAPAPSKTAQR